MNIFSTVCRFQMRVHFQWYSPSILFGIRFLLFRLEIASASRINNICSMIAHESVFFIISLMILPVKVMQFYVISIYQFSYDLIRIFFEFFFAFCYSLTLWQKCLFFLHHRQRQHQSPGILRTYIKTIFDCFTWCRFWTCMFGWFKRINSEKSVPSNKFNLTFGISKDVFPRSWNKWLFSWHFLWRFRC